MMDNWIVEFMVSAVLPAVVIAWVLVKVRCYLGVHRYVRWQQESRNQERWVCSLCGKSQIRQVRRKRVRKDAARR